MRDLSQISPEWLTEVASPLLINEGRILDNPPPFYSKHKDKIFYYVSPTFTHRKWNLPIAHVIFINMLNILEGNVTHSL